MQSGRAIRRSVSGAVLRQPHPTACEEYHGFLLLKKSINMGE